MGELCPPHPQWKVSHWCVPRNLTTEVKKREKEKTTSLFLFLKSSFLREHHSHSKRQGQPHRAPPTAEKCPNAICLFRDHQCHTQSQELGIRGDRKNPELHKAACQ